MAKRLSWLRVVEAVRKETEPRDVVIRNGDGIIWRSRVRNIGRSPHGHGVIDVEWTAICLPHGKVWQLVVEPKHLLVAGPPRMSFDGRIYFTMEGWKDCYVEAPGKYIAKPTARVRTLRIPTPPPATGAGRRKKKR